MQELLNSEAARYFEIEPYSTILSSIGKGNGKGISRISKTIKRGRAKRQKKRACCFTMTIKHILTF